MDIPHDHIQTVRSLYEAWAHRDAERCAALVDPEIEWTSAENFIYSDHSPYKGAAAVLTLMFGRVLIDWNNFSMGAAEILGSGDIVIANGRFRGTYKANGASIDAQFVQVFQFKDGKVSKCQVYTDTAQFKETIAQARTVNA